MSFVSQRSWLIWRYPWLYFLPLELRYRSLQRVTMIPCRNSFWGSICNLSEREIRLHCHSRRISHKYSCPDRPHITHKCPHFVSSITKALLYEKVSRPYPKGNFLIFWQIKPLFTWYMDHDRISHPTYECIYIHTQYVAYSSLLQLLADDSMTG